MHAQLRGPLSLENAQHTLCPVGIYMDILTTEVTKKRLDWSSYAKDVPGTQSQEGVLLHQIFVSQA